MRDNRRLAVCGIAAVAILLTGLGVHRVAHRREVVRLGYELSAATAELRRLQEEHRRLRLETSVLTHPDRIERLAQRLGLRRPAPEQIRVVGGGAVALASGGGAAGGGAAGGGAAGGGAAGGGDGAGDPPDPAERTP
ncbi:MAG TPA: cell division protein FtsL [Kofleriaceae bacterium]|nr:cell division protein FtsL [Kofleriaceae bacterium]